MTSDIYQAPVANLDGEIEEVDREFYVVSAPKFFALSIATFGFYELYWFYRHWKNYSVFHKESMWPVARSLFSIFFMHSLTSRIDTSLRTGEKQYRWWPKLLASVYVLITVAQRIADRFSGSSEEFSPVDLISFGFIPLVVWCLYRIQIAANIACEDPQGSSNSSFTLANSLWLIAGGLIWALLFLGIYIGMTEGL